MPSLILRLTRSGWERERVGGRETSIADLIARYNFISLILYNFISLIYMLTNSMHSYSYNPTDTSEFYLVVDSSKGNQMFTGYWKYRSDTLGMQNMHNPKSMRQPLSSAGCLSSGAAVGFIHRRCSDEWLVCCSSQLQFGIGAIINCVSNQ